MTIRRVLIIDDEPDLRAITRASLELVAGWDVQTAENGAAGIELARAELPELILLDVMMPDTDGPATFGRLRSDAATAHIPVIFLTAKVQASEIEHLTGLGALGVIGKPFNPMSLPGQIEQLLLSQKVA